MTEENCTPDPKDPAKCWKPGKKKFRFPHLKKKMKKADPPKSKKIEEAEGATHMNVRDISNNPGDTRLQPKTSSSALTSYQEAMGRKYEKENTKSKEALMKLKKKLKKY